jgi:hypothetical protein
MRIKDQIFSNDVVVLDGNEFDGCCFSKCKIIYRAERATALRDNEFEDCEFVLEGAARLTMGFLKGMMDSSDGFLLTMLRTFSLDAARLDRLSTPQASIVANGVTTQTRESLTASH